MNPSDSDPVHLLQIWIKPQQKGGEPLYADMNTAELKQDNGLALFASGDGRDGSMAMRQDAEICFGKLKAGHSLAVPSGTFPGAWLHLIRGKVKVLGEWLEAGDGVAIEAAEYSLEATEDTEFLLFKLG